MFSKAFVDVFVGNSSRYVTFVGRRSLLPSLETKCFKDSTFRRTFSNHSGKQDGETKRSSAVFSLESFKKALFPYKASGGDAATVVVQQKPNQVKMSSFQMGASQAPKNKTQLGNSTAPAIKKPTVSLEPKLKVPSNASKQAAKIPEGNWRGNPNFLQMSNDGENITRFLFKMSMLLFTIPFALTVVARTVMVSSCIQGFESQRAKIIRRTLKRVRSIVRINFLASWFEGDEGVLAMMNIFRSTMDEQTLEQFIITCRHLLRFPATREALVKASLLSAVEESLQWAPDDQRPFLVELRDEAALATAEINGSSLSSLAGAV